MVDDNLGGGSLLEQVDEAEQGFRLKRSEETALGEVFYKITFTGGFVLTATRFGVRMEGNSPTFASPSEMDVYARVFAEVWQKYEDLRGAHKQEIKRGILQ